MLIMVKIGGNTDVLIQKKTGTVKNAIGENVTSWEPAKEWKGWLDFQSGDSKHTNFNAKIQESTHVFVCDYFDYRAMKLKPENTRMIIFDEPYEILLYDDPMELHQQLEIFLKYIGGDSNV